MKITKDTILKGKPGELLDIGDVEAENCKVILEFCNIHNFYALNCVVTVRRCMGKNIKRNFVQLDKCHDCVVEWNEVINQPGKTGAEDNINLYMAKNCTVSNNYVEGATPSKDFSGSGIMVDKACFNCSVTDNTVVNTQNAGIGLAGGSNNTVARNRVISRGPGCNGNVGIYIANQYKEDKFENNVGMGNRVAWIIPKGRNDWWVPDAAKWDGNLPLKVVDRNVEFRLWLKKRLAFDQSNP